MTKAVIEHTPDAAVIVPPRATAVPSAHAETNPTQRDQHLQSIAEHGRMAWQKSSRYNVRALVEAFFSRWKRVIGDGLRFRTDDRRNTEIAIAVRILNHMLVSMARTAVPDSLGCSGRRGAGCQGVRLRQRGSTAASVWTAIRCQVAPWP